MSRLEFSGIDDIKRQFADQGNHWFTPETLRWWRGRVLETLYGPGRRLFVSSERNAMGDYPRVYSLRMVNYDDDARQYSIQTIGDLGAFATAKAAQNAARVLSRVLTEPGVTVPRYVDSDMADAYARLAGAPGSYSLSLDQAHKRVRATV